MKNKNILIIFSIVFIVFLVLILWVIFNKNKKIVQENNTWSIFSWSIINKKDKNYVLTVIEDKRNPETDLTSFYDNLKKINPDISKFSLKKLDFSEDSTKKYLQKNNINTLPAIIFSTNDFDSSWWDNDIKNFLITMESWEYFLNIWSTYNPFTASERWLPRVDKSIFEEMKKSSFYENTDNNKIVWFEFSDLSCPYCQKFNKSWIIKDILDENDGKISKYYNHLIVHNWPHFEILECFADQKGKDWFFSLLKNSFDKSIYKKEDLLQEIEKSWWNNEKIENCLLEWKFSNKIKNQSDRAISIFWIRSTPTSIFINSETLEYKIVSWFSEKLWKQPYIDAINAIK